MVVHLISYCAMITGAFESDDDESDEDWDAEESSENLCIPALNYLQQCCVILARMWNMPSCPIFNGAHRSVPAHCVFFSSIKKLILKIE